MAREARAVDRAVGDAMEAVSSYFVRGGGDRRQLRGIPVIGHGVGGTSPGTDPYASLDNALRQSA